MFEFLPAAELLCLEKAPLVQVIAQVRFSSQAVLGTHEGAGAVHDLLADMYPRLLIEQQQIVTMTPSGSTTASVPQYRMTDLNRAWSVVLGTDQLSVETANYSGWEDLRSRLEAALKAVTDLAKLRVRERVGLRYTNNIQPAGDGTFNGRVRSDLLGPASDEGWHRHIISMIEQIIAKDEDAQLLLRAGIASQQPLILGSAPSDTPNGFLIDIDCFNEQPREFSLEETLEYFDQMNDVDYRCFCWAVPDTYRSQLTSP